MSNLKTAIAAENEIMKAADVTFGYDSVIDNIAVAMKSILSGSANDYVIGGKVTPYGSGGLNVSIAPIYAFKNSTELCVAETEVTEPVAFEEADSTLDRIDIIEVCAENTSYANQTRAINDPTTGTKSYVQMATKKKVTLKVLVKKGSNGSAVAPSVDTGYVKLAEVIIPAGTNNISTEYIKNVTARKGGVNNDAWTTNRNVTFNPGYLSEILYNFLVEHNEDGTHKNSVIKAANIDFGTDTGKVKGSVLPAGQSFTVRGTEFASNVSVTSLIESLVNNVNALYPFANNLLGRYSFLSVLPVAASTANIDIATGGTQTIDGIACTVGQLVFLKDQTAAKENGFYEVQTGAWNRYTGYTETESSAFNNKLILVTSGTANAGKVFYLDDTKVIGTDNLNFYVSIYSPKAIEKTFMTRDFDGRSEVNEPISNKQISNKLYTDKNIYRNTGTKGIGFAFGNERFMTFDFTDATHKSIAIKAGTHIRLDIVANGNTEERWYDVDTRTIVSLATKMQAAADASSTRTGQLNGRDYYIYLVPTGTTGVELTVSCNSTYPNDISADYTANNTRKIGQFATLCTAAGASLTCKVPASPSSESVGNSYLIKQYNSDDEDGFYNFYNKQITAIASGTYYDVLTLAHPLAGFAAGDILPESVFCLTFKPFSNANGMVYDVDTDIAVDIYLQSGRGRNTFSVFGGTITDTRPEQNHQDDMRQVKKRLLWDYEFTSIASGSNEGTNIAGSGDPVTTGGHTDTAGRRMISIIGCEDCCGATYQWLSNESANGSENSTSWDSADGQGSFGKTNYSSYALLAGGGWNNAANCGSRCRGGGNPRSSAGATVGGRGASRVLRYA